LVGREYTIDVDGYFGPGTEQAVRDLQRIAGLEIDRLVGPNTWSARAGQQPGWDLDDHGIVDPDEVVWDQLTPRRCVVLAATCLPSLRYP
jgi:hypothetical protein